MNVRPQFLMLNLAALALFPSASSAGVIAYDIGLNTSPLVGHAAGPFSLEFQLNDGSGSGNGSNTAVLSDFVFGGGAPIGLPTAIGGAAGDAATMITLTDSAFFNQFVQEFTPGSQLGFRLALSTNVEPGGVPDQFTFAIIDSSGTELPALSFFDVFVLIDIDSEHPLVQTFAADTSRSPIAGGPPIDIAAPTAVSTVPEPATGWLLVTALCGMGLVKTYRRRAGRF